MLAVTTIGLDCKVGVSVHGVDVGGTVVIRKRRELST